MIHDKNRQSRFADCMIYGSDFPRDVLAQAHYGGHCQTLADRENGCQWECDCAVYTSQAERAHCDRSAACHQDADAIFERISFRRGGVDR